MIDDIVTNPASGERVRWHVRSADTGGRLLRLEMWCAPGGGVPHRHVHPHSEERFELLSGRVELEAGGRKQALGPGDSFAVPAGVPHRWRVAGDEEAHFFVELDDPRTFEEQLETLFALGRAGALRPGGEVPLPLVACLALDHLDSGYLAGPPLAVQRVLLGALRGVARLTGHRTTYDRARAEARERLSVLAYISAA